MANKKLRQRIIDICNGAGMWWNEEYEYWEWDLDCNKCMSMAIRAIEREFNIEGYCHHMLDSLQNPDKLTCFIDNYLKNN